MPSEPRTTTVKQSRYRLFEDRDGARDITSAGTRSLSGRQLPPRMTDHHAAAATLPAISAKAWAQHQFRLPARQATRGGASRNPRINPRRPVRSDGAELYRACHLNRQDCRPLNPSTSTDRQKVGALQN